MDRDFMNAMSSMDGQIFRDKDKRIAELQAELADTVTECLAAKSNEDIMRKQLAELRDEISKLKAENAKIEDELAEVREWFLDEYGGELPLEIMEILWIDQGTTKGRWE